MSRDRKPLDAGQRRAQNESTAPGPEPGPAPEDVNPADEINRLAGELIEIYAAACDDCMKDARALVVTKIVVNDKWTSAEVGWVAARHAQVHVPNQLRTAGKPREAEAARRFFTEESR